MNLTQVHDAMHDFVVGRLSHDEAASRLGFAPESADAERLMVWRRAYLYNVEASSAGLFPITRDVIVARAGEAAWTEMNRILGQDSPPPETRFASAALVTWLQGAFAESFALPAWIGELADLELWERRIFMAPDEPIAQERDALVLAAPLALRRYRYDVFRVRNAPEPTTVEPLERTAVVAIWRAQDLRRTVPLTATGLRILQAAAQGGLEDHFEALGDAAGQAKLATAIARFIETGLLLGQPRVGSALQLALRAA